MSRAEDWAVKHLPHIVLSLCGAIIVGLYLAVFSDDSPPCVRSVCVTTTTVVADGKGGIHPVTATGCTCVEHMPLLRKRF